MDEFKRTILALASSSEIQLSLFPKFVCVGDELVLDFENAINEINLGSLRQIERQALDNLDAYIINHSGSNYQEHYTNNSQLHCSEIWNQIRKLALAVITCFEWKYSRPKRSNSIYIEGGIEFPQ